MRRILILLLLFIVVICSGFQLKKDVAKTLTLGKFISKTDGFTTKTDLTNARVTVKVRYNGGSSSTLSSNGFENDCDGYYSYSFTPNTLGQAILDVSNDGCLPYFMTFEVVNELDNTGISNNATSLSTISGNVNTANANILVNQSKLVTLQTTDNDTNTNTDSIITTQGTHTTTLNTIYEKANDTYNAVDNLTVGSSTDYSTILNNIWDKQNDTYDNTNTINNKIDRIRK